MTVQDVSPLPVQTGKYQNHIVNADILMHMNEENCQGGEPLRTHSAAKRGFSPLHAAKRTALSTAADTEYVSRVNKARYMTGL